MLETEKIKQLRELTGAGIVDVKKALAETGGDAERAVDVLRKQGKKIVAKKADRTAREGFIGSYIHSDGKLAAFVALYCETDFVARNEAFRELAKDIAMHVAAMRPAYAVPADVPEETVARERAVAQEQASAEGKPAEIVEKIVAGKMEKFFDEQCLLRQPFVKDDSVTVGELIEAAIAKMGEKIELRQFSRIQL